VQSASFRTPLLHGIVSRDEYFLKAYDNKFVITVHELIVFTIFCFLVVNSKSDTTKIVVLFAGTREQDFR
jgi:hypothetical protein